MTSSMVFSTSILSNLYGPFLLFNSKYSIWKNYVNREQTIALAANSNNTNANKLDESWEIYDNDAISLD